MKAYKGFNVNADGNLQCRDFVFEEGVEYTHDGELKLCESGFHACENPLDIFRYYKIGIGTRVHQVDLSAVSKQTAEDSKRVAKTIKVGAKLDIAGIVKAGIDFIFSKTEATSGDGANAATSGKWANAATSGDGANAATSGYGANAATSGYGANAATSGYGANAATSGDGANAATSGDGANAATSGYGANAATSGYGANAEVKAPDSIAAVLGSGCKARGGMNSWLVLTEREDDYKILSIKAVEVDGKTIKADTWYQLIDGEIVEAE
jgi:hypothetical protein